MDQQYHKHEHSHDHLPQDDASNLAHCHSSCCSSNLADNVDFTNNSDIAVSTENKAVYRIQNMDCPTEEALIRKKLAHFPHVIQLEFNLMQRVLTVHHNNAVLADIESALNAIDMNPVHIVDSSQMQSNTPMSSQVNWAQLAVAGVFALASEIVELVGGFEWLTLTFAIIAILLGGLKTYKKGLIAIRNINLNMNALMSFAVTGAVIIGQWPEAAMVMVLFTLAEAIEAKSMDRARNAIQALLSITPETATVKQTDGSWLEVDVKSVPLNAIISVKPGERIAMDGEIVVGHSTINQAAITGESLPVEKGVGDAVFAGTINEVGSFEYKVTALATNSTLSRIIHAVESAQASKAPTQRFVDVFAKIYTPIVFVIAIFIGIVPPIFDGEWFAWIYKALVLLVIACPCALVISTPVSIVSGLAAATRHGILVKGGMFLEQGRKIATLALDKTGTITYGKPQQTDFIKVNEQVDQAYVIQHAISLAARSDHPVSRSIYLANSSQELITVDAFQAVLGRGVTGCINGEQWYLGSQTMLNEQGLDTAELESSISALEQQGKTVVLLFNQIAVYGIFAVADTIKQSSIEAIATLKSFGVKTIMLTGDNRYTADIIAKQAGVDEVQGNLLPEDKLALISQLSANQTVAMVGDGINDAPALAKANIGFAMGAMGSDIAIETADVTLMDDDLRKIPQFIKLSKSTFAILAQNITFALAVKLLFFILTFLGETTMWMAVFADIGVSLLVVINGLRLLKK